MYAIKTDQLSRNFDQIKAVDRLNLTVPQGIIFGFLGPNGAGKTTTINLLLGLLEPTYGSALVNGFDCAEQSNQVRNSAGVLFQDHGLYERISVYDNLDFYGRIWKISSNTRKSRIQELLERFGLWERKYEITARLSKGMKQKLAIARSFLHQPKLIFLDEPTAGLDPLATSNLQNDLLNICNTEETTIFLTTHDLFEAEKICSEVAIINKGHLVVQGSPEEIQKSRINQRIEVLGKDFSKDLINILQSYAGLTIIKREKDYLVLEVNRKIDISMINKTIINSGGSVEEIKRVSNLEDMFLELTENIDDH